MHNLKLVFTLIINLLLTFYIEKEQFKLFLHNDELKFIENNYKHNEKQQHLNFFYNKYNIHPLKIIFFFTIFTLITWVILYYTINLYSVSHQNIKFLWLTNLMGKDEYSIINLYNLLPFSINATLQSKLPTDVISIVLVYLLHLNTKKQDSGSMDNVFFVFFQKIQILFQLIFFKDVNNCYCLILTIIIGITLLFKMFLKNYFQKQPYLIK